MYRMARLRALKSKMITVRIIAVPFSVLIPNKHMTDYILCCSKIKDSPGFKGNRETTMERKKLFDLSGIPALQI